MSPWPKNIADVSGVQKHCHRALLDLQTVRQQPPNVADLEAFGETRMRLLPDASRQIGTTFRIERRVAVRTKLRIVADPLAARRTLPPSTRRRLAAVIAETGRLTNRIVAVCTFVKEYSHFVFLHSHYRTMFFNICQKVRASSFLCFRASIFNPSNQLGKATSCLANARSYPSKSNGTRWKTTDFFAVS